MRATVCDTVGTLCKSRSAIRARSGTAPSSSSSKIVRRYISMVSMRSCSWFTPRLCRRCVALRRIAPSYPRRGGQPMGADAGHSAPFSPPPAVLATGQRLHAQPRRLGRLGARTRRRPGKLGFVGAAARWSMPPRRSQLG